MVLATWLASSPRLAHRTGVRTAFPMYVDLADVIGDGMASPAASHTQPPTRDSSGSLTDRPELSALSGRLRTGIAWKAASQLTGQVARTVMTVILAHLLSPSDFGLAGMVLLFTGAIQLLADVGFSASLVQLPTLTEEDCSTAFWTGLGIAIALFGVAVVVAPSVAGFYHEPRLRWMFVAVAAGFLTTALSTTQASLLWRRMEFRALELRGIFATLVSAGVGIGAAVAGLGTWSLILQASALSVTSMVAIWILSPWHPRLVFETASLRRMASFSSNVLFSRFLDYGDRNADNLLVGRFLGATALGIYSIGYSVILIPFGRLVDPIRNVMIPALAALQEDVAGMRLMWLRGLRSVASIVFPALAGVIVVCPDFVSVVLGHRWAPATRVIQILAWVALIQCVSFLSVAVYTSRNRSGLLLRLTALAFALDLCSFIVGLHWGVRGVASAYAITNTLVIIPLNLVMVTRLLECRSKTVALELRGVVEATLMMAALVFAGRSLLELEGIGPAPRLAISVAIGIAVYALVCRWREPRTFDFRLRPLEPPDEALGTEAEA